MRGKKAFLLKTILMLMALSSPVFIYAIKSEASTVNELKTEIEELRIKQLENDRKKAELEKKIIEAGKDVKTREGAIKTLNVAKDKIEVDIKETENKIAIANLSIEKLGVEIADIQARIQTNTDAVSSAFRKIDAAEGTSFIETILTYDNVSTLWDEVETLLRFQIGVKKNIGELKILRNDLQNKKNEKEKNKKELLGAKFELKDRNELVELNKEEIAQLLSVAKNKKFNYEKDLAEKRALGEAVTKELLDFESQLKLAIDPKSIPSVGVGVLSWPLDKILNITQYFGDTEFAKKTNAYNGKGHNGVDFEAAYGTRVRAALAGVVEGNGDTDRTCKGASFGKWVFIRHDNGLSTIYAHLSLITVAEGQRVTTGQFLGYSGYSGYVKPPGPAGAHLHFGVYASQGVKIMEKQSVSKGCAGKIYRMPIADLRAYLDPMLYL